MNVSQKCQYALRAILELAKRRGAAPTTISQIAEAQSIPPKFLGLILAELRQGGFVESRRGRGGGYLLVRRPERLTAGQIIRFVDGPISPVKCITLQGSAECALYGSCAFMPMWSRARDVVTEVYDTTTFSDLIATEQAVAGRAGASYCI